MMRKLLPLAAVSIFALSACAGNTMSEGDGKISPDIPGNVIPVEQYDKDLAAKAAEFDKAAEGKAISVVGSNYDANGEMTGRTVGTVNPDGSTVDTVIEDGLLPDGSNGQNYIKINETCLNYATNCLYKSSFETVEGDKWIPSEVSKMPRMHTDSASGKTAFLSTGVTRTPESVYTISDDGDTFAAEMDDSIRTFTFGNNTLTIKVTTLEGTPVFESIYTISDTITPYEAPDASTIATPEEVAAIQYQEMIGESASPTPSN